MTQILKKIKITRKKPKNLKSEDNHLFNHEYSKTIEKSKVKIINNVYISDSKIKKFKYFRYMTKQWRMNPLTVKDKLSYFLTDLISLFQKNDNKETITIEKAIWAIDSRSNQYFHWLTDAMQRLESSKNFHSSHKIILTSAFSDYLYVEDSLDILGIEFINLSNEKNYFVKELVLAERVSPAGNFRKEIIKSIASRLKNNSKKNKKDISYEKVWVSRQNAEKRKIINFEQIEPLLKKQNFKILEFENIKFSETIEILKNCKIIGGVHGAGLTNMIFMNEYSKVIELRAHGDNKNNCFFSLASDFDHDYYYFLGKSSSDNFYNGDLNINPEEFKEFLNSDDFN
tara:strand:- start:28598 stop:29623 length:1026 start_codon:yes stop_codon:yes gene_type:complete